MFNRFLAVTGRLKSPSAVTNIIIVTVVETGVTTVAFHLSELADQTGLFVN